MIDWNNYPHLAEFATYTQTRKGKKVLVQNSKQKRRIPGNRKAADAVNLGGRVTRNALILGGAGRRGLPRLFLGGMTGLFK